MKVNLFDLKTDLNRISFQEGDRANSIALAIALAVVRKLPIPSSPVEDPSLFYNTNCLQNVNNVLSQLNEGLVFNLAESQAQCRRHWQIRYNAAHPGEFPIAGAAYANAGQAMLAYFGISLDLSERDLELFMRNAKSIMMGSNCVCAHLCTESPE